MPNIEGQVFRITSAVQHKDTVAISVDRFGGLTSDIVADSPAREFVEWVRQAELSDGNSVASQGQRLQVCHYNHSGENQECRSASYAELGLDPERRELLQATSTGGLTSLLVSINGAPFEVVSLGPANVIVDVVNEELIASAQFVSAETARVVDPEQLLELAQSGLMAQAPISAGLVSADGRSWIVDRRLPAYQTPLVVHGDADTIVDYNKILRYDNSGWSEIATAPGVGPAQAGPGGIFTATTVRRSWPLNSKVVYGWSPDGQRWTWQSNDDDDLIEAAQPPDGDNDLYEPIKFVVAEDTVLGIAVKQDADTQPVFRAQLP